MNTPPASSEHRSSAGQRRLLVAAIVLASAALVWSQLPKVHYATDLSRIGQGQATLVLAMDSNYLTGASVMNLLNGLRDDFDASVQFLVASLSVPDGRAFAERHDAVDGTVLLFDAQGRRVAVLVAPQSQDELRRAMQQAFGR